MIELNLVAAAVALLLGTARLEGQRCMPAAGGVSITLDDAIARARRYAVPVQRERAALARRRAEERAAGAALFPRLDASASLVDRSYNRAQQGMGPLPDASTPVVGPFGNQDYRITARMVITPFAAWRAAIATHAEARAAESALSASSGDAAYDAARAYVRLADATAECSARLADLALARRLLDITRTRVRLGAAPRTDSLRAAALVAAAEGDLTRASFVSDTARTALLVSMGMPVGTAIVLADSLAALIGLPTDTNVTLATAQRAQGELAALAGRERAARLRVRAAAAASLPLVTVTADAGGNGPGLGDIRGTGSVALGISIPMFDGGRVRARVEERRADAAEAATELQAARVALATEWADARAHVRATRALLASAQEMDALAMAALDDTEARYRGGDVGSLDIVAAMQGVVHARDAGIDASSGAAAARLQWMHAIGAFDGAASPGLSSVASTGGSQWP